MDIEWELLQFIDKTLIKEDICMKFYKETLLGAGLLQTKNGMRCPQDDVSHSSIFRLIGVVSKIVEKCWEKIHQHREKEWTSLLLFVQRGNYHHGSQASGTNLQGGHNQTITETSMYTTKYPMLQNHDTMQVQPRPFHNRWIVITESWIQQWQWNTRHEDKHWCGTHSSRPPRMHVSTRYTTNNMSKMNTHNSLRLHWPLNINNIREELGWYRMFKDDLAVIEGIIMKGRCIENTRWIA